MAFFRELVETEEEAAELFHEARMNRLMAQARAEHRR